MDCSKNMSKFIRIKLLEEMETATILDLCTRVREKLMLRELYAVDDYCTDNSENNPAVLTDMKETQSSLEKKLTQ